MRQAMWVGYEEILTHRNPVHFVIVRERIVFANHNQTRRRCGSDNTWGFGVVILLHSYQKNFIPPVQPTGLTVYRQPSLYPYGLLAARYP